MSGARDEKEASMEVVVTKPKALPYWGLDSKPDDRPGVSREAPPHPLPGTHWMDPPFQPVQGKVLFNGQDPISVGTTRYYTTPRIKAGTTKNYTVSATYRQNGQMVTQSHQISVGQGQTVAVNF